MKYTPAPESADLGSWGGERTYATHSREICQYAAEGFSALEKLMGALPCQSGEEYYLLAQMAEAAFLKGAAEVHRTLAEYRLKHGIDVPPAQTLE